MLWRLMSPGSRQFLSSLTFIFLVRDFVAIEIFAFDRNDMCFIFSKGLAWCDGYLPALIF